jgi:LysR family transcriptional regulator, flagellar master operon regulator
LHQASTAGLPSQVKAARIRQCRKSKLFADFVRYNRIVELDQLATFLEIIELGSLAAAAARLNVTPSTVTARLNSLEQQLGCRLLHRNKSGAQLTSAGFKLQRYAELMTQLSHQARHELSMAPGVVGICNIGVAFDLWSEVASRFIDQIRRNSARVATATWPGEDRALQRWLDSGLIDIAFCYAARAGDGFSSRLLFEDQLIMVAARPGQSAHLDDSYIYVDHGEEFRRQHAHAFVGAPPSLVTIAASEWALEYLQKWDAKGYLPTRMVTPALQAGRLHRVEGAVTFARSVYLVQSTRSVHQWDWYEPALAALQH